MKPSIPLVAACCLGLLYSTISAAAQVNVLSYHNDNARTGMNLNEAILAPANLNSNTFGKLFSYSVDGYVYAQPLYVSRLTLPGLGTHNLLFIATQHNSVYAFDADNNGPGGGLLWHVNLGTSAVTPTADFGTRFGPYNNITPEVGITSTPVIDLAAGTIYVDAFTHEGTNYFHRLHALNITDGTERAFSPVLVTATFPGSGVGSSNGIIAFVHKQQIQRSALTLAGGVLYVCFAGYADTDPYHGWVIGFDAANLQQLTNRVFVTTPNSTAGLHPGEGAIWMGGCGPAVDEHTNLIFGVGNGPFNATNSGGTEYSDSFLKLSTTGGLAVADYFTPFNQTTLESSDLDIGGGGTMLIPDQAGPFPHLLVGAGKEGRIYLVNRDQFTTNDVHYNSSADPVVQTIAGQIGSCVHTPAYFNGRVYFAGNGNRLKAFSLVNGLLSTTPVSTGSRTYAAPGATPVVSANGTNNGIVWALANANPAVLVAYNPANLTNELYNTAQAAGNRDRLANGVKFTLPIVANGKVYVGNQLSVSVLGLLNPYDNWKYAHFGTNAANAAITGDFVDPDGDGAFNVLEYALASDPTTAGTDGEVTGVIVANRFQLHFHRSTGATDVTYAAQVADSIAGPWSDLMTYTKAGGWVANTGGTTVAESVTVGVSPDQYVEAAITDPTDLGLPGLGSRFYRLKVHR